jgi:hypothetical protein
MSPSLRKRPKCCVAASPSFDHLVGAREQRQTARLVRLRDAGPRRKGYSTGSVGYRASRCRESARTVMQSAVALVDVAVGEKDGNRIIVGSRHSIPALLDDAHLNQATGIPKNSRMTPFQGDRCTTVDSDGPRWSADRNSNPTQTSPSDVPVISANVRFVSELK